MKKTKSGNVAERAAGKTSIAALKEENERLRSELLSFETRLDRLEYEREQDSDERREEYRIDLPPMAKPPEIKLPAVKKNKSGSASERSAVNQLKNILQKKCKSGVYIFVDRDAGGLRHTSSGWDFLIARGPYCVFVEAKVGPGRLTEYQEFTRAEVKAAGGRYLVARFSEDGKRVAVDAGTPRAVADVSLTDFFQGVKMNVGSQKAKGKYE